MNPITSIDGGFLDYYTLAWPLETAGQDDALVSVALVVMKRNGVGFIPVEDLQAASDQESGSVLGPHTTFTIPAIREDGQAVLEGQDVEVLVIDASNDVVPALGNFESVDGASFFFADDASLAPAPDQLLRAVKDWLAAQSSSKTAFYSADEEMIPDPVLVPETPMEPDQNPEEETPKGRKPAAAKAGKRVTTASLAEQLGSVTELLPAIASRLDMIQQEQITMKGQLAGAEHIVPPRPSQQPVSTSLSAFAKLMGSPPRVKATPAVAVRSIAGLARQFLRSLPGIKGRCRQGKAASRAIQQLWSVLLDGHPECLEKDEACLEVAPDPRCCFFHGLLDGDLLGKVRWLRVMSRARPDSVLLGSHLRLCSSCRFGWSKRACGIDNDVVGTSCTGQQQMGASLSVDAPRGSSESALELSSSRPEPSASSFRSSLPSTVGDHSPGLHERSRLHPEPKDRPGQASSSSCGKGPFTEERRKGEQEEGWNSRGCRGMRGLAQHGLDESPLRRDAREEFKEVEKDAN